MNVKPEIRESGKSFPPRKPVARVERRLSADQLLLFARSSQLSLFELGPEIADGPVPAHDGEELKIENGDLSVIKSDGLLQILVSGFGVFLGKKSERLVVRKGRKVVHEFPLFRLNEVVVGSAGISLSADLVDALCRRGIRTTFLSSSGIPYAMLSSPMLGAVVEQRREQILAYSDERSVIFSREVVKRKIRNQSNLLRYFGKYVKTKDAARFEDLEKVAVSLNGLARKAAKVSGRCIDELRPQLMGLEGTAGRLYWKGVQFLISENSEFTGRKHRGADDHVNAALNYGYGILYSQIWGALMNAGLEPFAGFLHVDRPGKPSLVLDLIEEFRQPVVDRAVFSAINLKVPLPMSNGQLDGKAREEVAKRVLDQLDRPVRFRGKNYLLRSVIQSQARNLAAFLRGERGYKAYSFRW